MKMKLSGWMYYTFFYTEGYPSSNLFN